VGGAAGGATAAAELSFLGGQVWGTSCPSDASSDAAMGWFQASLAVLKDEVPVGCSQAVSGCLVAGVDSSLEMCGDCVHVCVCVVVYV
jgi:hypothetical protein